MIPKPGNPHGEERAKLRNVSMKLDEETYQMLVELECDRPNIQGRRSTVLRQAVREMHARLQK